MPIIRVKRGTTKPTTSNLTNVGEMAFNYSSNELFIRGQSSVVKVGGGGEMELIYQYEGSVSSHKAVLSFSNQYFYKVHVIAATNGGNSDSTRTTIYYHGSNGSGNFSGGYLSLMLNDRYSSTTRLSAKSISSFDINDGFSRSVTPSYAVTKVIDFEISPTFESSYSSTYTWVSYGKSITTVSDQSNAPISMVDFVHAVDGSLGGLTIDPGLDMGSTDSLAISIYRIRRK